MTWILVMLISIHEALQPGCALLADSCADDIAACAVSEACVIM